MILLNVNIIKFICVNFYKHLRVLRNFNITYLLNIRPILKLKKVPAEFKKHVNFCLINRHKFEGIAMKWLIYWRINALYRFEFFLNCRALLTTYCKACVPVLMNSAQSRYFTGMDILYISLLICEQLSDDSTWTRVCMWWCVRTRLPSGSCVPLRFGLRFAVRPSIQFTLPHNPRTTCSRPICRLHFSSFILNIMHLHI